MAETGKPEEKQFVCVSCPKGCVITIKVPEDAAPEKLDKQNLSGYKCKQGIEYARQELVDPSRVLTTTVRIKGIPRMLPVRSSVPVPKERIFDVMRFLDDVEVKPPIKCRDVVVESILDMDIDIVATWSIREQV